jgi:predicted transcriptional regulator of viral defense system
MRKKSNFTDIEILRSLPVRVDYLLLRDKYSAYKSPKKKIFDLKKKGYLHPIKRGQYFNSTSKDFASTPYEIVANSLYFPSYVSMEWALQFYGLITDRVTTVTSVTPLRSKEFKTPYAVFSYEHLNKKRYPVGYIAKVLNPTLIFFVATPEKALIDYVNLRAKNLKIKNENDISSFLKEDLRLDLNEFLKQTTMNGIKDLLPYYHRNSKEYRILKYLFHKKEREA